MPYRESRTLLQKLPGLTVSQTLLGHPLDNLLRIHWGMLKYLILDIQISQSERMQRSHAVQQMLTSRFSIEREQSQSRAVRILIAENIEQVAVRQLYV